MLFWSSPPLCRCVGGMILLSLAVVTGMIILSMVSGNCFLVKPAAALAVGVHVEQAGVYYLTQGRPKGGRVIDTPGNLNSYTIHPSFISSRIEFLCRYHIQAMIKICTQWFTPVSLAGPPALRSRLRGRQSAHRLCPARLQTSVGDLIRPSGAA